MRARYYNQNTGRFLTMDTFPGMMFEPMSLHKYAYTHNNPINYVDPSGESLFWTAVTTFTIGCFLISLMYRAHAQNLLDQYEKFKDPVKWNGWYAVYTSAKYKRRLHRRKIGIGYGPAIGILRAHLTSEPWHDHPPVTADYHILLGGFTLSIEFSLSGSGLSLESPGLFGPNPKILTGPVNFGTISGVFGIGRSDTEIRMGLGEGVKYRKGTLFYLKYLINNKILRSLLNRVGPPLRVALLRRIYNGSMTDRTGRPGIHTEVI